MKGKLLFTPGGLPFVLKALGCDVNEHNQLVDANGNLARDEDGTIMTTSNIGGFKKGLDSTIFLRNDLLTAIKLAEGFEY